MFCVNCGKQIPDGAAFCPSCGSPVQAETTAQTYAQQEMNAQQYAQPDMTAQSEEKKFGTREILMLAAIVVLAIAIIWEAVTLIRLNTGAGSFTAPAFSREAAAEAGVPAEAAAEDNAG